MMLIATVALKTAIKREEPEIVQMLLMIKKRFLKLINNRDIPLYYVQLFLFLSFLKKNDRKLILEEAIRKFLKRILYALNKNKF